MLAKDRPSGAELWHNCGTHVCSEKCTRQIIRKVNGFLIECQTEKKLWLQYNKMLKDKQSHREVAVDD